MALAVLLGTAAAASGHFSVVPFIDTYVDKNSPDSSFSENDTLWVTSTNNAPVQEAFMTFKNTFEGVASSPQTIESATMVINATEVKKPGTITAYFLHGAVTDSITWSDNQTYDKSTMSTFDITKPGKYTIDATSMVKRAIQVCESGCPYSIVLVANDSASVGFASNENPKMGAVLTFNTF